VIKPNLMPTMRIHPTLYSLLTLTLVSSGFPLHAQQPSNGLAPDYESFDAHFKPGEPRTTEALLRIAGRDTPVPTFPPGTRFEYTNLGYDAAGLVIDPALMDFVDEVLRQATQR
jgi:CubicO group peptidase (beta-lactamase class C family)